MTARANSFLDNVPRVSLGATAAPSLGFAIPVRLERAWGPNYPQAAKCQKDPRLSG